MTGRTKIQWATHSANTFVYPEGGWHCVKVSEGCRNCYSEAMNRRFGSSRGNGRRYRVGSAAELGAVSLNQTMLDQWSRMRTTHRIFVNSMTDTFLESHPTEMIWSLFDAMAAAPQQLFYVLTKRAERMAAVVEDWLDLRGRSAVPENIMCGVSVEHQRAAKTRLHWLRRLPALRFLSVEPLLEPVTLRDHLPSIHEVFLGGESGTKARAMRPEWASTVWEETAAARVSLFFKQWGAWWPLKELATYHGAPDNALAYDSIAFVDPDGRMTRGADAFDGRYAPQRRSVKPITADGDYGDLLLVVKPLKEQQPARATLNGLAREEHSDRHGVFAPVKAQYTQESWL